MATLHVVEGPARSGKSTLAPICETIMRTLALRCDCRRTAASPMSTGDEFIHSIDDALAFISNRSNELAQCTGCDGDDF